MSINIIETGIFYVEETMIKNMNTMDNYRPLIEYRLIGLVITEQKKENQKNKCHMELQFSKKRAVRQIVLKSI